MTRLSFAWALYAALAACVELTSGRTASVTLDPILDSLYVGAQTPPPTVTYFDGQGGSVTPSPSQIGWESTDPTVMAVAANGRITALKRGVAVIVATVQGTQGGALIAVSDPVDVTLLVDTLYLLLNDTMTIPTIILHQLHQTEPAPTVSYEAPPEANGVYTLDANGRVMATGVGGPVPYTVRADGVSASGSATGAVFVLNPTEATADGKAFFSVLGTAVTHVSGPARAVHYRRANGKLGLRLRATYVSSSGSQQLVQVTLPDSVVDAAVPGGFVIDSIGPTQATALPGPEDATCTPPVGWALWSATSPPIAAYSLAGGQISVTQVVPINGGEAISGRFAYRAKRDDAYSNPLGVLTITGSFVAPLVTDPTISCT
jgi:hypothetical protein